MGAACVNPTVAMPGYIPWGRAGGQAVGVPGAGQGGVALCTGARQDERISVATAITNSRQSRGEAE